MAALPELSYDLQYVDPEDIGPGSDVRDMRDEGIREIATSIRASGWKTGSLVLVYRAVALPGTPAADHTADVAAPATPAAHHTADVEAPETPAVQKAADKAPSGKPFLCLDGMHRVMAVCSLIAKKDVSWPSDWPKDPASGRVKMQVGVLREEMSQLELVQHALVINKQTEVCVRVSQLNYYSAFEALSRLLPDHPSKDKKIKAIVESRCVLGEKTVSKDYKMYSDFKKHKYLDHLLKLGNEHGHGWFSRTNLKKLSVSAGARFFLEVFDEVLRSRQPFLADTSDAVRAKFFSDLHEVVIEYYNTMQKYCEKTRPLALTQCCMGDQTLRQKAIRLMADSLEEQYEPKDGLKATASVRQEICALVNKEHDVRYPGNTILQPRAMEPTQWRSEVPQQRSRSPSPSVLRDASTLPEITVGESTRTDSLVREQETNLLALKESLPPVVRLRSAPLPDKEAETAPSIQVEAPQEAVQGSSAPESPVIRPASAPSRDPHDQESFSMESNAQSPGLDEREQSESDLVSDSDAESDEDAATRKRRQAEPVEPTRSSKRSRRPPALYRAETPNKSSTAQGISRRKKTPRSELHAFDDDPSASGDGELAVAKRPEPAPSTIPDESAIFRVFGDRLAGLVKAKYFQGSPFLVKVRQSIKYGLLRDLGYAVVGNIFGQERTEEDEVQADFIMSRQSVDQLFQHFATAFGDEKKSCCSGDAAEVCWDRIHNDGSDKPQRFQTPREAIHQHLEKHHPELFEAKLRLDLLLAVLLDELSVHESRKSSYFIPRTGARLLLSAPGCPPQQPHTDFEVRFTEFGAAVPDPSYFMVVTGGEAASILAWPASHHLVSSFDYFSSQAKGSAEADVSREEEMEYSAQKPQRVSIPPYSAFVGRGDLVHAGDGHDGDKPAVRAHIHCVATKDKVVDNIFLRSFGSL